MTWYQLVKQKSWQRSWVSCTKRSVHRLVIMWQMLLKLLSSLGIREEPSRVNCHRRSAIKTALIQLGFHQWVSGKKLYSWCQPEKTADNSWCHQHFPAKWYLRKTSRNSILMTCPYPGLASGSDWLKQILTNQKHRSWKVTHHQYRISVLVPKTVVALWM